MNPNPRLGGVLPRLASWMNRLAGTAALLTLFATATQARTWTSADGSKTFEGDLKTYDPATGTVGVTQPNGKALKFTQDKLSAADIAFLKEQGAVSAAPAPSGGGTAKALPDVLPDPDGKEADMSKPVQVFIMMGQSNMVGMGSPGSLETAVKTGL